MNKLLMLSGARKIVRICAGVKSSDRVLIVTDAARYPVAATLAAAVREVSDDAVVITMPENRLDGEEPHALAAEAMLEADVVFAPVTRSISHSHAVKVALENGARVLSLAKFEPEQLYRGGIHADFEREWPRCERVARRFDAPTMLRVTSPAGTDLSASIDGRTGNSHPCIAREPGQFTAIINVEANVAPVEGTAEGVIVVNGSVSNFDIGPVKEPIVMEVERGRVTRITGGAEARKIRRILEEVGDDGAYNIAQVAVGLNPECHDFNGWFLNEHGVFGSIHIGIGTSQNLGGSLRAPLHFDVMMAGATLELDGVPIVVDHDVLVPYPEPARDASASTIAID